MTAEFLNFSEASTASHSTSVNRSSVKAPAKSQKPKALDAGTLLSPATPAPGTVDNKLQRSASEVDFDLAIKLSIAAATGDDELDLAIALSVGDQDNQTTIEQDFSMVCIHLHKTTLRRYK